MNCVCADRFSDAGSRVAWTEVLQNTIVYHHRMSNFGGSTGSGSFAGTSTALRWFSAAAALRRGLPMTGSMTGNGSTLIPVGSMQSNGMVMPGGAMGSSAGGHGSLQHMRPTMLSSSSSLFGMVHRARSPNTRASSSSTLSNQAAVVTSKSNTNHNHSANNSSSTANHAGSVLPPLKNGPSTSSPSSPPTQQYLPRSRLGSHESHALDAQASVSPIFGNSPIVRQGVKHFVGHQSNGDNHNNNTNNNNNNKVGNNSAPNSLNGTPVVTKNKRTPPIFAVPFKNPQQQSQQAQSSLGPVTRERFGSCDSGTSDS